MVSGTKLTAALVLAALALGTGVLAQTPNADPGQRGRQARRAALNVATVPVSALDAVVTLTADQKTKISAIQDKLKAEQKSLAPARGAQPDPANRQKLQDLRRQATTDIMALLTDEQKAKLRQATPVVTMMRQGGVPLELLAELDLTAEQKASLASIAKEAQAKTREIPRTATPDERRTKQAAIREEVRTKVTALLTDKQKAAVEKYMKEHPRGRAGRRRGAGTGAGAGTGTGSP